MDTITIEIEVEDDKLRNTLFTTIDVETEATKTDRGEAKILLEDTSLKIVIEANDHVAARAITNSIMRLLEASIDVAESINIKKE